MQHLLALISMHACTIKKKYLLPVTLPVRVDEICEHIPENCFKHSIVVHKSSNSCSRKLLNYLIHEKYIQFSRSFM